MRSNYGERLAKGHVPWLIDTRTGVVMTRTGEQVCGVPKSRSRRLRRARQAGAIQVGPYTLMYGQQPPRRKRRGKSIDTNFDSFGRRMYGW